jgi:hypothetical protein
MKFTHRLGYYLGGFSLGLVFLAFFLSGKRTSCAYGPNARTMKNISIKERHYSNDVTQMMSQQNIDSLLIANILKEGSVNFSKSNTDLDSCKIYVIEASVEKTEYIMTVENCENYTTILSVSK